MDFERFRKTYRLSLFAVLLLALLLTAGCGGEQTSTDGRTGTITGSGK